ncbi:MAG TPA: ABC transporter, partial [Corynebacterium sp.]|nr:ABC transporter [Corynebacterium sp.]
MASPVDKRLLSLIPPVSRLIARTGVIQAAATVLLLARGVLIGWVAAQAIIQTAAHGTPQWDTLLAPVLGLLAVVLLHGGVSYLGKWQGSRSVGDVVDTLRVKALAALRRRDPRQVQERSAHWRTVLTDGIAEFRPYLSEFLPSLV